MAMQNSPQSDHPPYQSQVEVLIAMARIEEKQQNLLKEFSEMKNSLLSQYVTKADFLAYKAEMSPVRVLVYGFTALILLGFAGVLVSLGIHK